MKTVSRGKHGIISRFFRFLWRSLKAVTIFVYGIVAILIVGAVLFSLFGMEGPKVPESGALLINPVGSLVEQKRAVTPATVLQDDNLPQEVLVRDITDALALASDDSRVKLAVLQLDNLQHGQQPKLERIASAIEEFKASGKNVIAVGDNYNQSALFIAAHADEVLMNPEGVAAPEGLAIYRPYFKSFLDKHEVSVNIFKVGKYKSAVDPFLRDDMSEEDRVAWRGILNPLWNAYTTQVENARGMAAGSIDNMLENAPEKIQSAGGNLARLAMEEGLVDRLVTDSERRKYLIKLAGEDTETQSYRRVPFKDYLNEARLPLEQKDTKVAVIRAVGNIVDGNAPEGEIGGKSLSRLIRKARLNEDVKAIVLRIDSGGGSKSASEIIRSELQAAQDAGISVVASMGSVAASGGYWIAASADEIWALPTTITGSIGIFGMLPSVEKTLANHGIYTDGVATTPLAGGASFFRGVSPAYGEVLQSVIEAGYQQFLTTVASGRGMEIDAVHEVAQGRVWTGAKARDLGLVDELGDLEEAIDAAVRLADVEDYSLWYVEPELSVEEKLLRKLAENARALLPVVSTNPFVKMQNLVRHEVDLFEKLNDPHHAYVICGGCPDVR